MDPTDEPNITLPLSLFSSCTFKHFADRNFPEIRQPLSKHPADLASVLIMRYAVGYLLKHESDPQEQYYHVELFDEEVVLDGKTIKYHHAEVWLIYEWRESVARHCKFRAAQAKIIAQRNADEELQEELADALTGWKLPDDYCKKMSKMIVEAHKKNDISALLKQFGLIEIIAQHEEKHKI